MNILVVLAGEVNLNIKKVIKENDINYIVAVDGGSDYLEKEKIEVDLFVGDCDSTNYVKGKTIIKLDKNKDYTDYEHALKYIRNNLSYKKIYVLGALSLKRPEHFYANLKNIDFDIEYIMDDTRVKLLKPGEYFFKQRKYISFFALEKIKDLNLEGFEYGLKNYDLDINDTLCISNEIKNEAKLNFKEGKLIVFLSEDKK